jgi:hypothetical protein
LYETAEGSYSGGVGWRAGDSERIQQAQ